MGKSSTFQNTDLIGEAFAYLFFFFNVTLFYLHSLQSQSLQM